MQQSPSASDSEATHPTTIEVSALPMRALLGVVGLVVLTVSSLALAWVFPDMTLLHFVCVAQAVPILYLFLAWLGMPAPPYDDDAP
jgi:hypothetical protein